MVFVPTPTPPGRKDEASSRCGTQRATMRTNVLIHRAGLAEVKKSTFANPSPDEIFGAPRRPDPEGAKELTGHWKEHVPDPDDVPGPDFRKMNKLAAVAGVTTASELPAFRANHFVTLSSAATVKRRGPPLPSDTNPDHTYGAPGSHRTAEQVRHAGPADPQLKPLIQNQFAGEWCKMNAARAHEFDRRSRYIPPRPTLATQGHSLGAQRTREHLAGETGDKKPFILSKFKKTPARVTQFIKGPQVDILKVSGTLEEATEDMGRANC